MNTQTNTEKTFPQQADEAFETWWNLYAEVRGRIGPQFELLNSEMKEASRVAFSMGVVSGTFEQIGERQKERQTWEDEIQTLRDRIEARDKELEICRAELEAYKKKSKTATELLSRVISDAVASSHLASSIRQDINAYFVSCFPIPMKMNKVEEVLPGDSQTYIQAVPDKCDRIIWKGKYYRLPLQDLVNLPSFKKPIEIPPVTQPVILVQRLTMDEVMALAVTHLWTQGIGVTSYTVEKYTAAIESACATKWKVFPLAPTAES